MPGTWVIRSAICRLVFISAVTRACARRGGDYGATGVVRGSIHVTSW
jgi:hypothetical protein